MHIKKLLTDNPELLIYVEGKLHIAVGYSGAC